MLPCLSLTTVKIKWSDAHMDAWSPLVPMLIAISFFCCCLILIWFCTLQTHLVLKFVVLLAVLSSFAIVCFTVFCIFGVVLFCIVFLILLLFHNLIFTSSFFFSQLVFCIFGFVLFLSLLLFCRYFTTLHAFSACQAEKKAAKRLLPFFLNLILHDQIWLFYEDKGIQLKKLGTCTKSVSY